MPVCSWGGLIFTCVLMVFVEVTPKQALTVDSRSSEILVALGNFRVRTGKPDQAEILYKLALDMA